MTSHQPTTPDPQPLSSNTRSIISLALIAYLFGLWVLLSCPLGNEFMSGLHMRLGGLFQAVMGETLAISVTGSPYYIHSGEPYSDDHLLELELTEGQRAGETVSFNEMFANGSQAQDRLRMLAIYIALQVRLGEDAAPAQFATSLAAKAFQETGATRGVFRLRRHMFQPMELGVDGAKDHNNPGYFETSYEADVWVSPDGQVRVLKRSSLEHVAPAVGSQS